MANEAHLEIMKQGVGAWNKWRRDNLHLVSNLCRADLNGASLRSADLNHALLRWFLIR
jgi:uncharacterized protein YjbI with pentapeptide repeats